MTSDDPPTDWPHFLSSKTETPEGYRDRLASVLLLERLREVNALIGYTRVEAPEESTDPDERPPMADLSRNKPDWIPASEVHGEGIFIRFDENAVAEWEKGKAVQARSQKLEAGHRGWRNARGLDPDEGYPESDMPCCIRSPIFHSGAGSNVATTRRASGAYLREE